MKIDRRHYPEISTAEDRRRLFAMRAMLFPLLMAYAVCFDSCNFPEEGNTGIPPQLFAQIYTDILIAKLDSTALDSSAALQQALSQYNVSEQDYKQTLEHYNSHPEIWQTVFAIVVENLEQRTKKKPTESAPR